jgi:hypothetical protein
MPEPYLYQTLEEGWIRVLQLSPARQRLDPLQGKLVEVKLDSKHPYETLSYVWGAQAGTVPILCDGKEILITENCEAALKQLRHKRKPITIWVDAICINQADKLERNSQVGLMGDIYKISSHLRIWLGNPASSGGLHRYWLYLQVLIKLNKPFQWLDEHLSPRFRLLSGAICSIFLDAFGTMCKSHFRFILCFLSFFIKPLEMIFCSLYAQNMS